MSCKLLLVEGVPGVGKSTLLHSLTRRFFERHKKKKTFIHLSQAHTYGPLVPDEDGNSLSKAQNLAHLEAILRMLTWHVESVGGDGEDRFLGLIETLHITQCFRPGVLDWNDVRLFDRRLAEIGCKLVFLQASAETIWQRTVVQRKNTPFIATYGKKFGGTLEEIHDYFVREQDEMHKVVRQSGLPKLVLDNGFSMDRIEDEALDFWLRP